MTTIFNRISEREKRRLLRANTTFAEKIMWHRLKSNQLCGSKFRRQYSIGPYIADFYSPELKLVIEIDGDTHFTDEAIGYDKVRQKYIESLGIRVIRFTNDEVVKNIERVCEVLAGIIMQHDPPVSPLRKGGA